MNQTELGYFQTSQGLREKIYLVFAMLMQANYITKGDDEYQASVDLLFNRIIPLSKGVFLSAEECRVREDFLSRMMDDCEKRWSAQFGSLSESEKKVYVKYGKELEKKRLGRPYSSLQIVEFFQRIQKIQKKGLTLAA
ncbi:hypothetical protein MK805_12865 [Shimazuella sp. AN120528]|uniref:hypothetical protein n=1 Tax=Shimazuella soli TaxID=1892854 RepID=UPI001F0CEDE4|nr:hypothetical protein [Shimazuella soli]MCH5585833.1 hypothetical protein [Shimazuella soli]